MDPTKFALTALRVLESLNNLLGSAKETSGLEDLDFYISVFHESARVIECSPIPPSQLAVKAMERCRDIQDDLESTLSKITDEEGNRKQSGVNILSVMKHEKKARELGNRFRLATLDFQKIASQTQMNDLLRGYKPSGEIITSSPSAGADGEESPLVYADLSLFLGFIHCTTPDGVTYAGIRGKYDTGSDVNIVSEDVVEYAGLMDEIDTAAEPVVVKMLGAAEHTLDREIALRWSVVNSPKSYETRFFVEEDCAFDMLLGNEFILKNNALSEKKSVLWMGIRRSSKVDQQAEELKRAKKAQQQLEAERQRQNEMRERRNKRKERSRHREEPTDRLLPEGNGEPSSTGNREQNLSPVAPPSRFRLNILKRNKSDGPQAPSVEDEETAPDLPPRSRGNSFNTASDPNGPPVIPPLPFRSHSVDSATRD